MCEKGIQYLLVFLGGLKSPPPFTKKVSSFSSKGGGLFLYNFRYTDFAAFRPFFDFRFIPFEDDILALPFTGFVLHDRFRPAGLEFRFKNFLLGTNVYTNESDGLTLSSSDNALGTYYAGKQLSSPVYVGYADRGLLIRSGINHPIGGLIGQNSWHRFLFQTSDFQPGDYKEFFSQLGTDKTYTLY